MSFPTHFNNSIYLSFLRVAKSISGQVRKGFRRGLEAGYLSAYPQDICGRIFYWRAVSQMPTLLGHPKGIPAADTAPFKLIWLSMQISIADKQTQIEIWYIRIRWHYCYAEPTHGGLQGSGGRWAGLYVKNKQFIPTKTNQLYHPHTSCTLIPALHTPLPHPHTSHSNPPSTHISPSTHLHPVHTLSLWHNNYKCNEMYPMNTTYIIHTIYVQISGMKYLWMSFVNENSSCVCLEIYGFASHICGSLMKTFVHTWYVKCAHIAK